MYPIWNKTGKPKTNVHRICGINPTDVPGVADHCETYDEKGTCNTNTDRMPHERPDITDGQ